LSGLIWDSKKINSYIGKKFYDWTVISHRPVYRNGDRRGAFMCRCKCGVIKSKFPDLLIGGKNKQCRSCASTKTKPFYSYTSYTVWNGMIRRCYSKNHPNYNHYGGRGISICDRWRESFENFYADMGERPTLKHSIERIDVNGNYEPSNCKWATQKEQLRNMRKNVILEYLGVRKFATDWAKDLGISRQALFQRLDRVKQGKFTLDVALSTPKIDQNSPRKMSCPHVYKLRISELLLLREKLVAKLARIDDQIETNRKTEITS